jgi:hypothetical protein
MAIFKSEIFPQEVFRLSAGLHCRAPLITPGKCGGNRLRACNCKILRSQQFAIWVIALRSGANGDCKRKAIAALECPDCNHPWVGVRRREKTDLNVGTIPIFLTMMRRGRSGSRGRHSGEHGGRGHGRGQNYTDPRTAAKSGLCAALGNNVFDYGPRAAVDQMRTSWEKLVQFVGTNYG